METFKFLLALQEVVGEKWSVSLQLGDDYKDLVIVLALIHTGPPALLYVPFEADVKEEDIVSDIKIIIAAHAEQMKETVFDIQTGKKEIH